MAYLLTAFGHQVLLAQEGLAGIEMARRERPDLILLDIHMPRVDGYEVAHQLQADAQCSKIPLVAVTAMAMAGDREKILASGFAGYIAKPLDPETFPTQVQGYLGVEHPASARPTERWQQESLPARISPRKKFGVVLFVDNMQTNIDLVRSILQPSGYEVTTAHSAKEGLELAKRTMPDLILSDVHMPYQDGYEFMRMVKADPKLFQVPFVFLSSSVWSTREREYALTQGATKFILRPIDPRVLLSEVEDCLQRKKEA